MRSPWNRHESADLSVMSVMGVPTQLATSGDGDSVVETKHKNHPSS